MRAKADTHTEAVWLGIVDNLRESRPHLLEHFLVCRCLPLQHHRQDVNLAKGVFATYAKFSTLQRTFQTQCKSSGAWDDSNALDTRHSIDTSMCMDGPLVMMVSKDFTCQWSDQL